MFGREAHPCLDKTHNTHAALGWATNNKPEVSAALHAWSCKAQPVHRMLETLEMEKDLELLTDVRHQVFTRGCSTDVLLN
jgi:hypothetical protein